MAKRRRNGVAMKDWLPRFTARAPFTVHAKLTTAFMIIVALLIIMGALGFQVLTAVNSRAVDLIKLHSKTAAFRRLQHDTTAQLYKVTAALLSPNERALESALRQLHQFRYNLERVEFVSRGEAELFGRIRKEHERLIQVVTEVVELSRDRRVQQALELRLAQAVPLADRLERLTNEMVNRAEADMLAKTDESQEAYQTSRWVLIGFAVGSTALALLLGYAISFSLTRPVRQMDERLRQIASGDFSQRVDVPNRDELGTLAAQLNRMNDELRTLYQQLEAQAAQLEEWNRKLEDRVQAQVEELERVGRLRRFLSPQVAELILSSEDDTYLHSHRRQIAVVFGDLRGFTAFSESTEPEEAMEVLQEYHEALGKLIHHYGGTIEHRAGDGIMVILNDPMPCEDPAMKAVKLAIAMRQRVKELSEGWRKRGHDLGFGAGVSLGYATLGMVGFEGRFDYSANGSIVNLASRLSDQAATGQILVSQQVYAALEDRLDAEPVGRLQLKGFQQQVMAFNVM